MSEAMQREANQGLALASRFIDPPETRLDQAWAWLSERTNPIVVKEARQSLNSSQFVLCFSIMLAAIVIWTLFALTSQLPNAYYLPSGLFVVTGYLVILGFPLVLVIPFSAFRSMIYESESRTFELVSISALSARQIVSGKMASACLQLVVYLSGIAPCIVITYLLGGIGLYTILVFLYFIILLSVLASALAILIATMSRTRMLQVLATILVLGGLLILFYLTCFGTVGAIYSFPALDYVTFPWLVLAGSIVLTTLFLCLRCAAASIDFPSENHAFAIRVLLLVWFGNIFFWLTWLIVLVNSSNVLSTVFGWILSVFLAVGALVVSEKGVLSPRAQRTLPRTQLGKLFFTWFYPGAGLGYVFLTCLLTAYLSSLVIFLNFYTVVNPGFIDLDRYLWIGFLVVCYFVLYTGITRLCLYAIPRTAAGRWLIGLIIQAFVVAIGCLGPSLVVLLLNDFRSFDYASHQALNIPWTIYELERNGFTFTNLVSIALITGLALLVFLSNFLTCSRDVLLLRVTLPPRVQSEQQTANQSQEPAVHPLDSAG